MLLRMALTDMADAPGFMLSNGALRSRRGDAGRGEHTPHTRGEPGVAPGSSEDAASEWRPLVSPELNLEVRSSVSAPSVAAAAFSSSQKPSSDASSFTPAEKEEPPELEQAAEEQEDSPSKLEEDLTMSRRLELRRELLRTARATDARLRLNHEPNSVSPPVV